MKPYKIQKNILFLGIYSRINWYYINRRHKGV